MVDSDITIIGGGIVGLAVAYELSKHQQERDIFLLERNTLFPGENQTSRNSGVIHAGVYYDKHTSPLKAQLCIQGNELLYAFCKEHSVPHQKTGKILVATNALEDKILDGLVLRSQENGVLGVKKLTSYEINEREPSIIAYSGMEVPSSGIIDPIALLKKLKTLSGLEQNLLVNTKVIGIEEKKGAFKVHVTSEKAGNYDFTTHYLINAAGLYSDKIARMVNPDFHLRIFPVRGESAKFYSTRKELAITRSIYPVPTTYPKPDGTQKLTVGVHLTPTFTHEVTVGPLNLKRGAEVGREDYGSNLATTTSYLERVKQFFPGLRIEDLHLHQTGIQAVLENGTDFHLAKDEHYPHLINLVGISSPGLTSSLAIAKKVVGMMS